MIGRMGSAIKERSRHSNGVFISLLVIAAAAFAAISLNHSGPNNAFMGDSITYIWGFPRINLGISGQTSAQILARFPTQITNRGYTKVFILAGTNDVLLGIDPDTTIRNIDAMATRTQQAHAEPILAKIPPIFAGDGKFTTAVNALNVRIANLASARGLKLVDYNAALRNHPREFLDGIHVNRRAYLRMELALIRATNPF